MCVECLNVYDNWLSCPHVILPLSVWTAAQELPDVSRISISNNAILGMCIEFCMHVCLCMYIGVFAYMCVYVHVCVCGHVCVGMCVYCNMPYIILL